MGQYISKLAGEVGARAPIHRNVRYVAQIELCFLQTIGNGSSREPCPVLNAPKALFFGRSN